MFTRRTIRPHVPVTTVDTASEALAVSISEKARVDMAYMAELSGKSEAELEAELSGVIFRDIQCAEEAEAIPKAFVDLERFSFVTADEYLSGNVRKKLQMAKALAEVLPAGKKQVQGNITALEAVQPVDLTAARSACASAPTGYPRRSTSSSCMSCSEPAIMRGPHERTPLQSHRRMEHHRKER
jgi:N12 class adenine-specific DNA methylase